MQLIRSDITHCQMAKSPKLLVAKDEMWYHGRISRTEAEELLQNNGKINGLYLVRESLWTTGEYVLSLTQSQQFSHYKIKRRNDGSLGIDDDETFQTLPDLIRFYTNNRAGLSTRLNRSCDRAHDVVPRGYRFVSAIAMEEATRKAAGLLGYEVC